jgi:undecaprenyl pyrophosphate synthase
LQSVALFLSQTDEFDRSSSEVARLIKKLSQSLENTNEVSSIVALWEAYDWLTFEKRVIASTTEELRALSRRVSRQIEKRERPKRLL